MHGTLVAAAAILSVLLVRPAALLYHTVLLCCAWCGHCVLFAACCSWLTLWLLNAAFQATVRETYLLGGHNRPVLLGFGHA